MGQLDGGRVEAGILMLKEAGLLALPYKQVSDSPPSGMNGGAYSRAFCNDDQSWVQAHSLFKDRQGCRYGAFSVAFILSKS